MENLVSSRRGCSGNVGAAARRLVDEVVEGARRAGARRLYVSACPTESSLGFYRSLAFDLVDRVHPELFALEPEDIHMILEL